VSVLISGPELVTVDVADLFSFEPASAGGGRRMRHQLAVPSKGDHEAMADYEAALAEFLEAALKRS